MLVLPTGPTNSASLLELERGGEGARVVEQGRRVLLGSTLGPAPIRDVEILPNNQALLADVGERGVALVDAQGELLFSLADAGSRPLISSASVSAYSAPGEVVRVLATDSNRSQAFVFNPSAPDSLPWIKGFALPGSTASFVNGIVMPGQLAAIGVHWDTLRISGVDLYKMRAGSPQLLERRIASEEYANHPEDTVIVPELEGLRDLMGLPSGNLLITTRTSLFELTPEGEIRWRIEQDQPAESGGEGLGGAATQGEFVSATLLPSGDFALATHQAGQWTAPHVNHRVYWLSGAALEDSRLDIIARSDALDFAPARLRPASEQGGSGSFGFYPGLGDSQGEDLDDLELIRALTLNLDEFGVGEAIVASADIENKGDGVVSLSQLSVELNSGACSAQADMSVTLDTLFAVDIEPGEVFAFRVNGPVEENFLPGRWCARLFAQLPGAAPEQLGEAVSFDIRDPAEDNASQAEVEELDFWTDADAGSVGTDTDSSDDFEVEVATGCGCASSPRAPSPAGWLGVLLFVGWRLRRR